MDTFGILKVPKFYTCIFPSRNGNAERKGDADVATKSNESSPSSNNNENEAPKPSLMDSTPEPNQDFYTLMNMFCYIIGSVVVIIMAIVAIWVTAFKYARRFTIFFYNAKRNTQIMVLVAGGVLFFWIFTHALILSPSNTIAKSKETANKPKEITNKAKEITNKPKEDINKPKKVVPQTTKTVQTKPEQVSVKPKAVSTPPLKVSHKSVCTTPEKTEPVKAEPVKENKKVEVKKDDKPNCMLRWLCPLFHSHSSANRKSVGTQIEKKKQCTKSIMTTECSAKQATKPSPLPCSKNAKKQMEKKSSKSKASGPCPRSSRPCGGESSSSESIKQLKTNLKPIQQQLKKENCQQPNMKTQEDTQQPKDIKCKGSDVQNNSKKPEQPKSICNVLATQHDPKKQSQNQIQISAEEGRQIYNRHRWYVTFLEMKQPPTILVYLRDYIIKYMES